MHNLPGDVDAAEPEDKVTLAHGGKRVQAIARPVLLNRLDHAGRAAGLIAGQDEVGGDAHAKRQDDELDVVRDNNRNHATEQGVAQHEQNE